MVRTILAAVLMASLWPSCDRPPASPPPAEPNLSDAGASVPDFARALDPEPFLPLATVGELEVVDYIEYVEPRKWREDRLRKRERLAWEEDVKWRAEAVAGRDDRLLLHGGRTTLLVTGDGRRLAGFEDAIEILTPRWGVRSMNNRGDAADFIDIDDGRVVPARLMLEQGREVGHSRLFGAGDKLLWVANGANNAHAAFVDPATGQALARRVSLPGGAQLGSRSAAWSEAAQRLVIGVGTCRIATVHPTQPAACVEGVDFGTWGVAGSRIIPMKDYGLAAGLLRGATVPAQMDEKVGTDRVYDLGNGRPIRLNLDGCTLVFRALGAASGGAFFKCGRTWGVLTPDNELRVLPADVTVPQVDTARLYGVVGEAFPLAPANRAQERVLIDLRGAAIIHAPFSHGSLQAVGERYALFIAHNQIRLLDLDKRTLEIVGDASCEGAVSGFSLGGDIFGTSCVVRDPAAVKRRKRPPCASDPSGRQRLTVYDVVDPAHSVHMRMGYAQPIHASAKAVFVRGGSNCDRAGHQLGAVEFIRRR